MDRSSMAEIVEKTSSVDAALHHRTCIEAISFLCAKSSKHIIKDVLKSCLLYCYILTKQQPEASLSIDWELVVKEIPRSRANLTLIGCPHVTEAIEHTIQALFYIVALTPWASEFARLEAEAGQKVAA
jgi:hypothetical protein